MRLKLDISSDKYIKKLLESKSNVLQKDFINEINASAMNIVKDAKRAAPIDQGELRRSIGYQKDMMGATAFVKSSYGAYIEFGTGGKVKIPAGFQEYAAQFKGAAGGGNMGDMLNDLAEWVRRKGLAGTYSVKTRRRTGRKAARQNEDLEVAYRIMYSILKNGINPQPFFIPSYLNEKPRLVKRLAYLIKFSR